MPKTEEWFLLEHEDLKVSVYVFVGYLSHEQTFDNLADAVEAAVLGHKNIFSLCPCRPDLTVGEEENAIGK